MSYVKTAWVNGGAPAISAANLNKIESGIENAIGLDDLADLRALAVPTAIFTARISHHANNGDGGGGLFWWDSSSTRADNNGTVITPNSAPGTGRWIRLYSGAVDVRWFGARGNGSTDDTAAFQAALDEAKGASGVYPTGGSGRNVFSIFIPNPVGSYYRITDTLLIDGTHGLHIFGERGLTKRSGGYGDNDEGVIRWHGSSSKPVFQLRGAASATSNPNFYITISDLTISGYPTNIDPSLSIPSGVALAGIYLGPLSGDALPTLNRKIQITECTISNCRFGIYSGNPSGNNTDHATIGISKNFITNCHQAGILWGTGNAVSNVIDNDIWSNGWSPSAADAYAAQNGANIVLVSGYMDIVSLTTAGSGSTKPTTADIYQIAGRVSINGAWSDVHGYFFYQEGGGSTITPGQIVGVRHFEGSMTGVNTIDSIRIANPGMTIMSCGLYGNLRIESGQNGRPVCAGINFIRGDATFVGSGVNSQRSLVALGTAANTAQITLGGRDAGVGLSHVGFQAPQLLSLGTSQVGGAEILQALGGGSADSGVNVTMNPANGQLEFLINCYVYDGSYNLRAHKAGVAYRIIFGGPGSNAINLSAHEFANTTTSVAASAFVSMGGIIAGDSSTFRTEASLQVPKRSTDPGFSSGDHWEGSLYYNTTSNRLRLNTGASTWVDLNV